MSEKDVDIEKLFASLVQAVEDACAAGELSDLSVSFDAAPSHIHASLAERLIPQDIEFRRSLGMKPRPEDYAVHGMECLQVAERFFAEHPGQELPLESSRGSQAALDSRPKKTDNITPHNETTQAFGTPNLKSNVAVGPYRLIRRLGEGGMGVVWRAEQKKPVQRHVALKVIRTGLASEQILARFDAERQALAMMNHPNIAKILDAGTTTDGNPWFAMELVNGVPLTKYCDQNRLSVNERLQMFSDVCAGLQHAHQKGIIHRDLKPGNILVGLLDGRAVPKIIDFGLAKALETVNQLTDRSAFTGFGQVVGTLKYMSPEQAGLDSIDIDTRTDIYAMGVILYELLIGSTPLDDDSIRQGAALKILEMIREQDPVRPSRKLDSSTEQKLSTVTNDRRTDRSSLNKVLAGDLDWIVMKALEKDRTRRYESATSMADDVRRYLNSEPIAARPPDLAYQVQKFVRKNRAGVIAVGLVLVAMLTGIVGTSWGMFRAIRAEASAVAATQAELRRAESERLAKLEAIGARESAVRAARSEKAARLQAQQRLVQVKNGQQILADVFTELDMETVRDGQPLEMVLAEKLIVAAERLNEDSVSDSLTVAGLQQVLGSSLVSLGFADEAIDLLEQAHATFNKLLTPNHRDSIGSASALAGAYESSGDVDKAIELFKTALQVSEEILGANDHQTIRLINGLAASYSKQGQPELSQQFLQDALERLRSTPEPIDKSLEAVILNNLGESFFTLGDSQSAEKMFEQTLRINQAELGPDHVKTINVKSNLAIAMMKNGEAEKALPMMEDAMRLAVQRLGDDHPLSLKMTTNLAGVYDVVGQNEKVLPMYQRVLEQSRAKMGTEKLLTLQSMNNLAFCYWSRGELDKSIPLFEELVRIAAVQLKSAHPEAVRFRVNLAVNYQSAGRLDEAIPLFEEALEAERVAEQKQQISRQLLAAYVQIKRKDKAQDLIRQMLDRDRASMDPECLQMAFKLSNYHDQLVSLELFEFAKELLKENLRIRKQVQMNHWQMFYTQAQLGQMMIQLEELETGVSELAAAYRTLEHNQNLLPASVIGELPVFVDQLIEATESLGDEKAVKKWQAERDKYASDF